MAGRVGLPDITVGAGFHKAALELIDGLVAYSKPKQRDCRVIAFNIHKFICVIKGPQTCGLFICTRSSKGRMTAELIGAQ